MKKIYLCIIILSLFFLTGCVRVDIGIGIDERYNAFLSYEIKLDVSEVHPQYHEALARAVNELGWYYQEDLGFTVGVNTSSETYTLTMRKSVAGESFAEAFESLKTMLTDESMTPFMHLDMAMESYVVQDSFIISAMLDIGHIIEHSDIWELPPDLSEAFEKGLETSGGNMLLTVPVSDVVLSSHDINKQYRLAEMEVPLSFTEQTEFELRANVLYDEDGIQTGSYEEATERLTREREIVIIVCGAVLVLLLLILLAVVVSRRRKQLRKHLFL